MITRVVLDVDGVDFDDDDLFETLAREVEPDVQWSEKENAVTATVLCAGSDPVSSALEVARWIVYKSGPTARVPRVNEELVGVSDIAARYHLNRETVRLWSLAQRGPGDFPRHRNSIGTGARGAIRIWALRDVAEWMELHYGRSLGIGFLTPLQVATLNEYLARLHRSSVATVVWQPTGAIAGAVGNSALDRDREWDDSMDAVNDVPRQTAINEARDIVPSSS